MRSLLFCCAIALALVSAPLAGYAHPSAETPPPLIDDALVAPPPSPELSSAADDLRGPSQYMAGKVAVRLVLPESNGSAEPSTESWTPDEVALVTAQVQSALDWWEARLPLARLSFSLRVDVAPTAYEPVNHGLSDEGLWIGDSLRRLGFDGTSYFDQVYAAGDANRTQHGADWTTTIFLVDSSAQHRGFFADGRFAYAYINGPFMVLTSTAGGYGTGRLAPIVAHELGHIFGALDQYSAARIPCERRSGYLNTPTSNSQYGACGTREPSIMLEPIGAFAAGQVDASALAQVGYRDSDHDGLIDPLDTAPALELAMGRLANGSARPILAGSARDLPYASPYQRQVTLNAIAGVEYRVNDGPWLPLAAEDGGYDKAVESFAEELPLYNGVYAVEVRARNSVGMTSPATTHQFALTWIGPQPAYNASAPPLTGSRELRLTLEAPASTSAVQVSTTPTFADAPWQPYTAELPFTLAGDDGDRTVYVRFKDALGLSSLPFALPVTLDTCPPTGSAARDPGTATRLIVKAYDRISGVAAVEVQLGDGSPAWQPYTPSVELGPGSEHVPVTLRLRDGAGNISAPFAAPSGYQVALPFLGR